MTGECVQVHWSRRYSCCPLLPTCTIDGTYTKSGYAAYSFALLRRPLDSLPPRTLSPYPSCLPLSRLIMQLRCLRILVCPPAKCPLQSIGTIWIDLKHSHGSTSPKGLPRVPGHPYISRSRPADVCIASVIAKMLLSVCSAACASGSQRIWYSIPDVTSFNILLTSSS